MLAWLMGQRPEYAPKKVHPIRPQSEKLTCLRLQHPVALIHAAFKRCDEFTLTSMLCPGKTSRIKAICLRPHRIARKETTAYKRVHLQVPLTRRQVLLASHCGCIIVSPGMVVYQTVFRLPRGCTRQFGWASALPRAAGEVSGDNRWYYRSRCRVPGASSRFERYQRLQEILRHFVLRRSE